jgi:hypothetical protein
VHESGQQARGFLSCGDVGNLAVQLVGDHGDAQGAMSPQSWTCSPSPDGFRSLAEIMTRDCLIGVALPKAGVTTNVITDTRPALHPETY